MHKKRHKSFYAKYILGEGTISQDEVLPLQTPSIFFITSIPLVLLNVFDRKFYWKPFFFNLC